MANRYWLAVKDRWRFWFPSVADRRRTADALTRFYESRSDYHAMTAKPEKFTHPQVQHLLKLIGNKDTCVEFGCGGGVVLEAVSKVAGRAFGADVSMIALQKSARRVAAAGNGGVLQADIARAPFPSGIADVAYSFEVLEHVWNPEVVIAEMIRVLRPGGLLFITTPNGFSLDLHLPLRPAIRFLNLLGAASLWARASAGGPIFRNMEPDLTTVPSYSDCDMITKIIPRRLEEWIPKMGCKIERLETYFFQKHKASRESLPRYDALEKHPFYRYYGDHIVLIAVKQ